MKFHEILFFSKYLKYLNNLYKLPKSASILTGVPINKLKKIIMSSFKSSRDIQKKEGGP